MGRNRFQLVAGLLIGVIVPSLLRWLITDFPPYISTEKHTIIGATVALLVGYVLNRRLGIFPGISSGGYIIPTYTVAYATVMFVFFFFRIEYSRMQFAATYLSTIAAFTALHVAAFRYREYSLAIIPGGKVRHLVDIKGVRWHSLNTPVAPQPGWDGVVADLRADPPEEWERMIADCALAGVPVYHVKQVFEQLTGRTEIERLSENTLGSLNPDQSYIKIKELLDWLAAAFVLVFAAPLMVALAILIRLDSPGPALFRQERVGFRGSLFTVYKFRTMVACQAAHVSGANDGLAERHLAMTKPGDARITRLGRLLRKTRLDELPQLINILKGEMSWIGPRPEAKPLTQWYESELPFYHYRHIVRPGLTGWAQVRLGHVAHVDEVREKLHFDFYYIKNFSFWLDLLIVLLTIRTIVTGHGAR